MDVLKGEVSLIFFRYMIPSVFGLLAISSASIVDGFFVGNYVGASSLAAITITLPAFYILYGIALMLAIGGSVVCGKWVGAGNSYEASQIFTKTLLATVLLSVFICGIILIKVDATLYLLGANIELAQLAEEYLFILIIFFPFLMVGLVLNEFVKIDNRPFLSFVSMLICSLVNMLLDWYFIVHLDYGLGGAALATGISYLFFFIVLLPHFFSKKATLRLVALAKSWMDMLKAAVNGASEFANEASVGITTLIFNYIMISKMGTNGVAAYSVVNYVITIGVLTTFGISSSIQPIISKHFGARKPERIKQFLRLGLLSATAIGLSIIIIMLVWPNMLASIFLSEASSEANVIVIQFILFVWPAFLFTGASLVISAYFTSMHKPVPSMGIAFSRSLLFPVGFLLILPPFFGYKGIFMAIPAAEFCTFIVALLLFKWGAPNKLIR